MNAVTLVVYPSGEVRVGWPLRKRPIRRLTRDYYDRAIVKPCHICKAPAGRRCGWGAKRPRAGGLCEERVLDGRVTGR